MQATLVEGIGARLREALNGRTYQWLSDETGISTSMLSDYGKGGKTPGADKAVLIADVLGVEISWLLTGRGSRTGRYLLPSDIAEQHGLDMGASLIHPNSSLKRDKPDLDMVYVHNIDLSFGLGSAIMDTEIVEDKAEMMAFPQAWLRMITTSPANMLYWARGQGNSMEPAIRDGDVILIDRSQRDLRFGDLYWAIAYGDTGMIKRLRQMPDGSVKILSDNPSVAAEIAYDGELSVFGRVVAVVHRL